MHEMNSGVATLIRRPAGSHNGRCVHASDRPCKNSRVRELASFLHYLCLRMQGGPSVGHEGLTGIQWNSFALYCTACPSYVNRDATVKLVSCRPWWECNFHAFSSKEICGCLVYCRQNNYKLISECAEEVQDVGFMQSKKFSVPR